MKNKIQKLIVLTATSEFGHHNNYNIQNEKNVHLIVFLNYCFYD